MFVDSSLPERVNPNVDGFAVFHVYELRIRIRSDVATELYTGEPNSNVNALIHGSSGKMLHAVLFIRAALRNAVALMQALACDALVRQIGDGVLFGAVRSRAVGAAEALLDHRALPLKNGVGVFHLALQEWPSVALLRKIVGRGVDLLTSTDQEGQNFVQVVRNEIAFRDDPHSLSHPTEAYDPLGFLRWSVDMGAGPALFVQDTRTRKPKRVDPTDGVVREGQQKSLRCWTDALLRVVPVDALVGLVVGYLKG